MLKSDMRVVLSLFSVLAFSGMCPSLSAAPKMRSSKLVLTLEKTPQYKDSKFGSSGSGNYWVAIRTEMEFSGARDEWIDEMEMNYKILLPRKNGRLVLLEQTHMMSDVQCGEKLNAVVYLRPSFIRRTTGNNRGDLNKIAVYVDCRVNGSLMHREPIVHDASGIPKGWFRSKDLGKMKKYVNEILPRFKTPFAPLDYDYYIPERQD